MKTHSSKCEQGTVLITALMTITILTLLSATSLYIVSQNQTTGTQTASWHQSLGAAESGVDQAIAALNTDNWANWRAATYATPSQYGLPASEPSPASSFSAAPTATAGPDSSHYYFLPSTVLQQTMAGEGALTTKAWVTVDTAGMSASQDGNGQQWYRIRSTGKSLVVGPARASMNRLDAELRNTISTNFSRKGEATTGPTRTIEVIMSPLVIDTGYPPLRLGAGLDMSGSGTIDSFKSSQIPAPHQWSLPYRRSNASVGLVNNTTNSDVRGTYIYGSLAYSGAVVKNTGHVGSVTTPGPPASSPAPTPNPALGWTSYTYSAGNPNIQLGGNGILPTYIKINGDLTISGGNVLHLIQDATAAQGNAKNKIYIWVTGKLTTSGSGQINQDANVNVVWYVGNDVTLSGDSYANQSGYASQFILNGYGNNNKVTISGSAMLTGVVYAPKYDVTLSGSGDFEGSITADTLTVSGQASFHGDEDLSGGSVSPVGNYSFASWFEDNGDPTRKAMAFDNSLNPILNPITY